MGGLPRVSIEALAALVLVLRPMCVPASQSVAYVFVRVGPGYCRDTSGGRTHTTASGCVDLATCEDECRADADCKGISWSSAPADNNDWCAWDFKPRCVRYLGTEGVGSVSGTSLEYTCYSKEKATTTTTTTFTETTATMTTTSTATLTTATSTTTTTTLFEATTLLPITTVTTTMVSTTTTTTTTTTETAATTVGVITTATYTTTTTTSSTTMITAAPTTISTTTTTTSIASSGAPTTTTMTTTTTASAMGGSTTTTTTSTTVTTAAVATTTVTITCTTSTSPVSTTTTTTTTTTATTATAISTGTTTTTTLTAAVTTAPTTAPAFMGDPSTLTLTTTASITSTTLSTTTSSATSTTTVHEVLYVEGTLTMGVSDPERLLVALAFHGLVETALQRGIASPFEEFGPSMVHITAANRARRLLLADTQRRLAGSVSVSYAVTTPNVNAGLTRSDVVAKEGEMLAAIRSFLAATPVTSSINVTSLSVAEPLIERRYSNGTRIATEEEPAPPATHDQQEHHASAGTTATVLGALGATAGIAICGGMAARRVCNVGARKNQQECVDEEAMSKIDMKVVDLSPSRRALEEGLAEANRGGKSPAVAGAASPSRGRQTGTEALRLFGIFGPAAQGPADDDAQSIGTLPDPTAEEKTPAAWRLSSQENDMEANWSMEMNAQWSAPDLEPGPSVPSTLEIQPLRQGVRQQRITVTL